MEPNFPKFILVQVQTEAKTKQEVIPSYLDGELNGDRVPDRVELFQGGNKIGFRLKLGTYQRITKTEGEKSNPLFNQIAATLSYTTNPIWEATTPAEKENGVILVKEFELDDFNKDGDTDIRFTIQKHAGDGFIFSVFVLMNQTIPDNELAALPSLPQVPSPTPIQENKENRGIKKAPGRGGPQRLGYLSR